MSNLLVVILILIVVVGAGLYFIGRYHINPSNSSLFKTGGVFNSSTLWFSPLGSTTGVYHAPGFGYVVGGGTNGVANYSGFGSYAQNIQIPPGYTRSQISPYFGQVRIGGVSSYYGFGAQTQMQIYSALPPGVTADVTSWHIKGNRGDVSIPQAVNFYDWTGLAPAVNIVLAGSSVVNIFGNMSPIGENLRLNKCTGFLNAHNNFNPSLPMNCPALYTRDQIIGLSGFCQSYIMSLGSCQVPEDRIYNLLPNDNQGFQCREFLNNITPKACYDQHRGDPDFLSNTWMVWINQRGAFDPLHDDLKLFDNNNLLVDRYTY